MSKIFRLSGTEIILWLTASLVYGLLSSVKHFWFETNAYDLGIFTQAIWQYSHFKFPFSTVLNNGVFLLGNHFGPFLGLFAPIYRIFPSAYTLLVMQSLWVSLGAIPVYRWGKLKFQKSGIFPLAASVIYLIHPGIQAALNFDFHLAALSSTVLSFLIFSGLARRRRSYWLWFAASMIVKEDTVLIVAMLGLYLILSKTEWRRGLVTLVVSGAVFMTLMGVMMPRINSRRDILHTSDRFVNSYRHGQPFAGALLEPITAPKVFFSRFFDFEIKRRSQLIQLLPFGLIPLLSPFVWILSAPILYERFQSDIINFWTPVFQYGTTIVPIYAYATINVVSWFWKKRSVRRWFNKDAVKFSVYASAWLIAGYLFLPLWYQQPLRRLLKTGFYFRDFDRRQEIMQAIKSIPPAASVTAQSELVPRLANRTKIYMYVPSDIQDGEYIILGNVEGLRPDNLSVSFNSEAERIKSLSGYQIYHQSESALVMKKIDEVRGFPARGQNGK